MPALQNQTPQFLVVMADDDEDDRLLAQDALVESGAQAKLEFVRDGIELLDYLCGRGDFAPPNRPKLPNLILLDLNMPRLDGREALKQIKADQKLRRIPIVILTTSRADEDVARSYDDGANSYVAKPVTFQGLVNVMKALNRYWAETVQLP